MACGINQSGLCKRKADMDRYGPVMAKTCRCPARALIHCMSLSLDLVSGASALSTQSTQTRPEFVFSSAFEQNTFHACCIQLFAYVPNIQFWACAIRCENDRTCKLAAFGWNHFLLAQVCETKRVDNCGGPEDLDERIESLGDKVEAYFCHGWTPCMCNYSIIIAPYHSKSWPVFLVPESNSFFEPELGYLIWWWHLLLSRTSRQQTASNAANGNWQIDWPCKSQKESGKACPWEQCGPQRGQNRRRSWSAGRRGKTQNQSGNIFWEENPSKLAHNSTDST